MILWTQKLRLWLVFVPNFFHFADVQLYKVAILVTRNMLYTVQASLIGSRVLPLTESYSSFLPGTDASLR